MNTFREVQALILGYRAADAATRARILELVPDLAELVDDLPDPPPVRRYRLIAAHRNGMHIKGETVVTTDEAVGLYELNFRESIPYADVVITVKPIEDP